jgi:hypothetical protein
MISGANIPPFDREKIISRALIIAAAWGVCVIFGWLFQPDKFYRAYLFAWLFWLGVTLGATGVVMLHHLMGGHWGFMVRRFGEHAGMTMPLLIVLFIPIIFGMHSLFPWARPDEVAHDPILRHELPYLNERFFLLRAVIYAVVWFAIAWYLRSASLRYGETLNPATAIHMHNVSAAGSVLWFALMSFASVDWILSREPHAFSTVFGFIIVAGQSISGLCVLIVTLTLMINTPPFREEANENHFNDLGNVLLTLVIVWAYMSFVQLLVVWMGNRQDEIPWYVHRLSNGWGAIGLVLVILHFFVPFIILLMRELKRKVVVMLWLCAALLVLRAIDLYWQVAPSGEEPYLKLWQIVSWMDIVFPIGMGGLWVAMYLWLWGDAPLIPADEEIAYGQEPALES